MVMVNHNLFIAYKSIVVPLPMERKEILLHMAGYPSHKTI